MAYNNPFFYNRDSSVDPKYNYIDLVNYFDAEFYLATYADIAGNAYYSQRPLEHYLNYGKSEGRLPSKDGVNPFLPIYGSSVNFTSRISILQTTDNALKILPASENNLNIKYNLKFLLNDFDTGNLLKTIEVAGGYRYLKFKDPSNIYKNLSGLVEDYSVTKNNNTLNEVNIILNSYFSSPIFNWRTSSIINYEALDYNEFKIYSKYDIVYFKDGLVKDYEVIKGVNYPTEKQYILGIFVDKNFNYYYITSVTVAETYLVKYNKDNQLIFKYKLSTGLIDGTTTITPNFTPYLTYSYDKSQVQIVVDSNENIYIGYINYIFKFTYLNSAMTYSIYKKDIVGSLPSPFCMCIDSDDNIYYAEGLSSVELGFVYRGSLSLAKSKNIIKDKYIYKINSNGLTETYCLIPKLPDDPFYFSAFKPSHVLINSNKEIIISSQNLFLYNSAYNNNPKIGDVFIIKKDNSYRSASSKNNINAGAKFPIFMLDNNSNLYYISNDYTKIKILNYETLLITDIETKLKLDIGISTADTIHDTNCQFAIKNYFYFSSNIGTTQYQGSIKKINIFYKKLLNKNKINNFGYCKDDLSSGTSSFTKDLFFESKLPFELKNKFDFYQMNYKNSFIQNIKYKENSNSIKEFNIKYQNISDKQTKCILYFLEKKQGFCRFVYKFPTFLNKYKVFICDKWSHSFIYNDCNEVSLNLIEDPNPNVNIEDNGNYYLM